MAPLSMKTCSSLSFRFNAYRILLCLDFSSKTFTMTSSLQIPYRRMLEVLIETLSEIQTMHHNLDATIDIQIIAHSYETDMSLWLWEGRINEATVLSAVVSEITAAIASADKDIANILKGPKKKNADIQSMLKHIIFHLDMMDASAFPIALVFTPPGALHIHSFEDSQNFIRKNRVMLNFVIVSGTDTSAIDADNESYAILAHATGGAVYSGSPVKFSLDLFTLTFLSSYPSALDNFYAQSAIIEEKVVVNEELSYGAAMDIVTLRLHEGYRFTAIDEYSDLTDENLDVSISMGRRRRNSPDITKIVLEKRLSKKTTLLYELQFDHTSNVRQQGGLGIKCSYSAYVYTPRKYTLPSGIIHKTPLEIYAPTHLVDRTALAWWKCFHQCSVALHAKNIPKVTSILQHYAHAHSDMTVIYSFSARMEKVAFLRGLEGAEIDFGEGSELLAALCSQLAVEHASKHYYHIPVSKHRTFVIFHHEILLSSTYHVFSIDVSHQHHYVCLTVHDLGRHSSAFTVSIFNAIHKIFACTVKRQGHVPLPLTLNIPGLCFDESASLTLLSLSRFETREVQLQVPLREDLFWILFEHLCTEKLALGFKLISRSAEECGNVARIKLNYIYFSALRRRHSVVVCDLVRSSASISIKYSWERGSSIEAVKSVAAHDCDVVGNISAYASSLVSSDQLILRLHAILAPLFSCDEQAIPPCLPADLHLALTAAVADNISLPLLGDHELCNELLQCLHRDLIGKMGIRTLTVLDTSSDYFVGFFRHDANSVVLVKGPLHSPVLDAEQDTVPLAELTISLLQVPVKGKSFHLSPRLLAWTEDLRGHIFKTHMWNYSMLVYSALLRGVFISEHYLTLALSNYRETIAEVDLTLLCSYPLQSNFMDSFNDSIGRYLVDSPASNYFLIRSDVIAEDLNFQVETAGSVTVNISTAIYLSFEFYVKGNETEVLMATSFLELTEVFASFTQRCYEQRLFRSHEIRMKMTCSHNTTIKDFLSDTEDSHVRDAQRQQRMKCLDTLTSQLRQFFNLQTLSTLCRLPTVSLEAAVSAQDCMGSMLGSDKETLIFDIISPQLSNKKVDPMDENLFAAYLHEIKSSAFVEASSESDYFFRQWLLPAYQEPILCWITVAIKSIAPQSKLNIPIQSIELKITVKLLQPCTPQLQVDVLLDVKRYFESACHKLNQKHLLRDMNTSKSACPLLLAAPKDNDKLQSRPLVRADSISKHDSPYYTNFKAFRPGCFECARIGEINCDLPSSAVINQETAMKRLEVVALSPFAVTNLERIFVTQDSTGNAFYLKFEADSKPGSITLGMYGVSKVDASFVGELGSLLQLKLVELSAKAMSTILARNSTVSLQHLHFLKNSGYAPRVKKYLLPAYVSDPYLLLSIVKQLILASQSLSSITYQLHAQRKFAFSEHLHPASSGYDLGLEPSESLSSSTHEVVGFEHRAHRLKRSAHVEVEDFDSSNPEVRHPVFFGRTRRALNSAREEKDASMKRIYWTQNDFTFLYNILGPLPVGASPYSKQIAKIVGHGLALIEISMDTTVPIKTGSKASQANDVRNLMMTLQNGGSLKQFDIADDLDGSGHTSYSRMSNRSTEHSRSTFTLSIYPTIPMQIEKLGNICESMLDHALTLYCIERLSASIAQHEAQRESERALSGSFAATLGDSDDLCKYIRTIQAQVPASIGSITGMASVGMMHVSQTLRPTCAHELHQRLITTIQETYASFRKPSVSASATTALFHMESRSSTLAWRTPPAQATASSFGDVYKRVEDEPGPTASTNAEIRLISDVDAQSSQLPEFLRKRRFGLEIIVRPTGLYVFYANLSPAIIRFVVDMCNTSLTPIRNKALMIEAECMRSLGIPNQKERDVFPEDPVETRAFRLKLDRLSWSQKTAQKLYLKLAVSASAVPSQTSPLADAPESTWQRGKVSSKLLLPMATDTLHRFVESIKEVVSALDIELLVYPDTGTYLVVAPIPQSKMIGTFHFSTVKGRLLVVERMHDLDDVVMKLADTPLRKQLANAFLSALGYGRSYRTYRYSKQDVKLLSHCASEHPLLLKFRAAMRLILLRQALEYFVVTSDQLCTYEEALIRLRTLEVLAELSSSQLLLFNSDPSVWLDFNILADTAFLQSYEFMRPLNMQVVASESTENALFFAPVTSGGAVHGFTFLLKEGTSAKLVNVFTDSAVMSRSSNAIQLRPDVDIVSVNEELIGVWASHTESSWSSHRVKTAWESIFFVRKCSVEAVSIVKTLSAVNTLPSMRRFSGVLALAFDNQEAMQLLLSRLSKLGPCFSEREGLEYIFLGRKLFSDNDVYDIGLLIERIGDGIDVYLLEREPVPIEMDEHVEGFLLSAALELGENV